MDLAKAIKKARRTYLCGNGGSAANAIHIANDLVACGVRAEALTADVATLTAIANDESYEQVFARQIRTKGEKGDVLLVLSGSGQSKNVLQALSVARGMGMDTWAVVGNYGHAKGSIPHAEHIIRRGGNMQEAEEAQLRLGHEAMKWLKNAS
jgi:D-sedoheptulose 7-phosphate isomerase